MAEFIIRDRVLTKYNGCKKVVHIPYGVTEIGQSAFMDHNEIESVTLPDSITGIGANAFFGCDAMKSINIPQGVGRYLIDVQYECFLPPLGCPDIKFIPLKALKKS